ncbi:hypothetical protein BFP70_02290 [Thioclava sp. SK-1]|uniref:hypothetical protein n=1 Tax=Thioclava sp. SK-1 TaxID=1889770 RepID=UPI00082606BF|nr:hypothetical protein [Thioclava sp. SK-1]OCX67023.1 hypothetical protein BFP70_02290 [Thioclava sp. SK-1]
MALVDQMAEKLAADVMQAQKELGPEADRLYVEVANFIGTSSPALEEAFLTACRVHLSEQRGRAFFEKKLKALQAQALKPDAG